MKERTSSIPDPSLQGFQHDGGDGLEVDNTLSATRFSYLQSENLWFQKQTFLLYNLINAKDASYEARAIKSPQSKPRTRKNKKKKSNNQSISSKQRD